MQVGRLSAGPFLLLARCTGPGLPRSVHCASRAAPSPDPQEALDRANGAPHNRDLDKRDGSAAVHGLSDSAHRLNYFIMAISIALLASIVAALAVLFYVVSSIQSYRRLSHIPGPPSAAFSILWQIRALNSGQNNLKVAEVNQKYGSLARIGPNSLVTSDPDLLRRMSAARSPYRRGSWYNAMRMKPRKDNILSVRDEKHHDELRRKMAFGYAGKENPLLEETIDKHIQECIDLIERKYVSSGTDLKKMDFGRVAQFLTLDIISGLAFDRPFGDIAHDQDMFEYIKTTEENLPVMILMTILPWVHKLLEKSYLMDFLAPSVKDKVGLGKIINIAQERVAERFLPDGKKRDQQDMLGSFIRHGLTQEEAESESVLQMYACFSCPSAAPHLPALLYL